MEASSFGIPIFATDVGGTKEIVINNKNGWLVNQDMSLSEIAKKLDEIIGKISTIRNNSIFGVESRKVWKKKFEVRKNTETMINIVERT